MTAGRLERTTRDAVRRFVVTFLLCFGVAATWSAASPMYAVPDEIAHMVRAAAAARGDIYGRHVEGSEIRTYTAPPVLIPRTNNPSLAHMEPCYAANSRQSPSCLVLSGDRHDIQIRSSATSYPPAYYLMVGWPSAFIKGVDGLYAMRVANAAVFAALLAMATASLGIGRRWAPAYIALAIAITPLAWFLGGGVSPSSIAIAAGIATWCGGHRVLTARSERPASTVWRFALPLCLLLVVRRDSLVWGSLIVAALAVLLTRERLREMLASRVVIGWGMLCIACGAYAALTAMAGGSKFVGGEATGDAVDAGGAVFVLVEQMVGVLGWLDTAMPAGAYVLWYMVFGALVFTFLALARRRAILTVVVVVALTTLVIVTFGAQRHPYFQGRYAMPLAVGVPLIAGLGLVTDAGSLRLPRRSVIIAGSAPALVHLLAYYQHLRRYALSGESTWWLFGDVQWRPPTAPLAVLVVAHVVLVALLSAWMLTQATGADAETASGGSLMAAR